MQTNNYAEIYKRTIEESKNQASTYNKNMLLSDIIVRWFEVKKHSYRENTIQEMQKVFEKHIYPYFQELNLPIEKTTNNHLEEYYLSRLEKGLHPNSVRKQHTYINSALKWAIKKELINENVAEYTHIPPPVSYIAKHLNKEEIIQYIDMFFNDKIGIPVMCALLLGLRRSEVVGLKWSDISENQIKIQRSVVMVNKMNRKEMIIQKKLKTPTSFRTLELSKFLSYYLNLQHQKQIARQKNDENYDNQYNGFICVHPNGKLMNPDFVTQRFRSVQVKNEVLFPIRYHDLRHTCASILYSQGASDLDVQKWMGHSDISTTANVYVHMNKTKGVLLAEKIDDLLNHLMINK